MRYNSNECQFSNRQMQKAGSINCVFNFGEIKDLTFFLPILQPTISTTQKIFHMLDLLPLSHYWKNTLTSISFMDMFMLHMEVTINAVLPIIIP